MKNNGKIDNDSLNNVIHLSEKLLKVFYIIVIVGIVLGIAILLKYLNIFELLGGALKVISPLFIGFVLAWLFHPLHKKLVSKGVNKILGSIIIFLTFTLLIFGILYFFIPVLYNQINDFISYVPNIIDEFTTFITDTIDGMGQSIIDTETVKENLVTSAQTVLSNMTQSLPATLINFVKGLISALGVIAVGIVVGIYMLIDFDKVIEYFYKLIPEKHQKEYIQLFTDIGYNVRKVVNGTLFVAFMVFVFDSLGFLVIGLKSAMLLGLFCGFTDLIPYIGPYIGGGAAVIVGFTQNPAIGLGVLIIAVIVQLLENYILQPVVMSKAMQLNPIVIIIGLLLFGYFFGILGMILATPFMSIIKQIIIFIKNKGVKRA